MYIIYKYTFSGALRILFLIVVHNQKSFEIPAKIVRVLILRALHHNAGELAVDHLVLKLTGSLYS